MVIPAGSDRRNRTPKRIIAFAIFFSHAKIFLMNRDPGASANQDVSVLLQAWSGGDADAARRLAPIVYRELRRLAGHFMKGEDPGHSLQATALVHEAYIRLVDYNRMHWQNRAHFFAVASQLMRRILVDHARRKNLKRGGGVPHVSLDDAAVVTGYRDDNLLQLDEAMQRLAQLDPRKVQVVEMRYFGGLSIEETAEVLRISPISVKRDWTAARAWLYHELSGKNSTEVAGHGSGTLEAG